MHAWLSHHSIPPHVSTHNVRIVINTEIKLGELLVNFSARHLPTPILLFQQKLVRCSPTWEDTVLVYMGGLRLFFHRQKTRAYRAGGGDLHVAGKCKGQVLNVCGWLGK